MSGSGGFYKYRCKYFYSHNCTNWVYVNGAPCAMCVTESPVRHVSREICVPRICDGTIQYMLMEFIESNSGNYWAVRHKAMNQPLIAANMVTADTPRAVLTTAGGPGHRY
ncbi:hypothetical protein B0T16DRAFT_320872 [Cercophora newfieldiana]|uniref:Uncharacterized protein n=1 Tax=Cercophora newfieldiana TaxID=92897 RepID=A0AA39YHC9_9PEZI|nr:hypothetical protein B0T16DRAFT_320872 [Cercophora newfieldiana]